MSSTQVSSYTRVAAVCPLTRVRHRPTFSTLTERGYDRTARRGTRELVNSEAPGKYELGDITFPDAQSAVRPIVRPATAPVAPPAAPPAVPVAPPAPAQAPVPVRPAARAPAPTPAHAASSQVRARPQAPTRGRHPLVVKKLAELAEAQQVPDGLRARLLRKLADLHPGYVVLALVCLALLYVQSRPEAGPGDELAEGEAEAFDGGELPVVPVNSVLLAFPAVLRPPAAAAMRFRIAGTYSTGVQWGSKDGEVSCMLVQHDAGKTQERIHALLTTGRAVPIPADALVKIHDVADSMRMARGGRRVRFTPVCLSI
jgi:hypothetical protein